MSLSITGHLVIEHYNCKKQALKTPSSRPRMAHVIMVCRYHYLRLRKPNDHIESGSCSLPAGASGWKDVTCVEEYLGCGLPTAQRF